MRSIKQNLEMPCNRLLLVISSFLFFSFSTAQTIEKTRNTAIYLLRNREIPKAIPLLKRCLFFANDSSKFDFLVQLGDAYTNLDSLENALEYYENAYLTSKNDSISDEIVLKKTSILIHQKKIDKALSLLKYDLKSTNSVYFAKRKHFYSALAHFKLHNYKAAENDFSLCFVDDKSNQIDSILLISKQLLQQKFLNPKKAKTLSKIVPGLGQWYAKDYKNSLNSFGLNAGLVSLGVWSAIAYSPFDAVIWVAPWLRRYYIGGFKKAELIAIHQNEKIENDYLKRILNVIDH